MYSCNTFKRERFKYIQDEKQSWINSYKYEAFYECINEGLENDSLKIILSNKDLFAPNLNIDFSTTHTVHMPGAAALNIASNYTDMFTVEHIHND